MTNRCTMRQITLSVPEERYAFILELLNSMDFVSLEDIEIPDEHKEIVRERKRTATPDSFKNWDEVKTKFRIN
jgi:hypothetical protein